MTGSIIPPSYFNWLSVCDNLSQLSIVASVLGGILLFLLCIFRVVFPSVAWDDEEAEKIERILRPFFKGVLICLPFFFAAAIFVPSKETLLSIMVAKFATYENAELTVAAIKDAVDYIVASIASLK